MPPPWQDLRPDFPALKNWIYLNAAAGSPTPRPVREAVAKYQRELEEGGDLHWDDWLTRREQVRRHVARLVGADPQEIAFVTNTSTGMNVIAELLGGEGPVLTDEIEFPTVTLPWIQRGTPVHFVPVVEGVIHLESFAAADAPRAATIVISQVQFANGCRQDLEAFGAIKLHRKLVVCASQGMGAFPVSVHATGIDALVTSGHKWLCAGYGAGFLYLSRDVLAAHAPKSIGWLSVENPFTFANARYTLLPEARRAEMGCPNFAGIFSLGAAVDYLMGIGIDAIAERILELNFYLTARLERAGFEVLSPGGEHRSGQTLCAVADPPRAVAFLRERRVLVTEKPQGIRISTHFYNDESDIDTCVRALQEYGKTL
jgi:cysteine desulfurase/selenocysteine lyase